MVLLEQIATEPATDQIVDTIAAGGAFDPVNVDRLHGAIAQAREIVRKRTEAQGHE